MLYAIVVTVVAVVQRNVPLPLHIDSAASKHVQKFEIFFLFLFYFFNFHFSSTPGMHRLITSFKEVQIVDYVVEPHAYQPIKLAGLELSCMHYLSPQWQSCSALPHWHIDCPTMIQPATNTRKEFFCPTNGNIIRFFILIQTFSTLYLNTAQHIFQANLYTQLINIINIIYIYIFILN